MKKRLEKRLGLRKETLQGLDTVRLCQVVGGLPPEHDENCTCYCPPPPKG